MATFTRIKGKWRAQIRRAGVNRSRFFPTKNEAMVWARQVEADIDRGSGHTSKAITLGNLIDKYMEIAPGRGRSKRQAMRHIRELVGSVPLAQADHKTFLKFLDQRRQEGAGPATIGMDFTYLGTALRHAGTLEGVPERAAVVLQMMNSVRYSMRHMGHVARPEERDRRPTDEELEELFFFWDENPPRKIPMHDIVLFAIATAMRLGEICSLQWEDLDTINSTILIRNRKHPDQRKKSRNDQRVPLLRGLVEVNGRVVDPMAIIMSQGRQERGRIFPYKPGSVSTAFTRAVQRCEIDDLHFHDLRHDAVSRLFEAGYSIEQVSLVSGHKSWENLRRYTNIKPESLHKMKEN